MKEKEVFLLTIINYESLIINYEYIFFSFIVIIIKN